MMNIKDPKTWDENYIQTLPVGEFDWLEVKGRRALDLTIPDVKENQVRSNLSKMISAFSNSGGGIIILGLEDPDGKWKIDDGGINLRIKNPSTREWLEDIIPNLVEFPLSKFNIYEIRANSRKSQIDKERGIFIIEVLDSDDAPHQALDKKYYARVAGKSRPIGHRLVKDIFGRSKYPKLSLEIEINKKTESASNILSTFSSKNETRSRTVFDIQCFIKNDGPVVAQYVHAFVYIPIEIIPDYELDFYKSEDFEEIDGIKYVVWTKRNTERDLIKVEPMGGNQYGSSWFDPILPKLSYSWDWRLSEKFDETKHGELKILWEVFADNAPVEKGNMKIKDIDLIQ